MNIDEIHPGGQFLYSEKGVTYKVVILRKGENSCELIILEALTKKNKLLQPGTSRFAYAKEILKRFEYEEDSTDNQGEEGYCIDNMPHCVKLTFLGSFGSGNNQIYFVKLHDEENLEKNIIIATAESEDFHDTIIAATYENSSTQFMLPIDKNISVVFKDIQLDSTETNSTYTYIFTVEDRRHHKNLEAFITIHIADLAIW